MHHHREEGVSIVAGSVCRRRTDHQKLVVVTLIKKEGAVFYDPLTDGAGGGAICYGPGSTAEFLTHYEPIGVMTFAGAWKKYKEEQQAHSRAKRLLKTIEGMIA